MPVCDDQGEIVKQSRFLQQLAKKFETWIFTNGTFDGIKIVYNLQIISIFDMRLLLLEYYIGIIFFIKCWCLKSHYIGKEFDRRN